MSTRRLAASSLKFPDRSFETSGMFYTHKLTTRGKPKPATRTCLGGRRLLRGPTGLPIASFGGGPAQNLRGRGLSHMASRLFRQSKQFNQQQSG